MLEFQSRVAILLGGYYGVSEQEATLWQVSIAGGDSVGGLLVAAVV